MRLLLTALMLLPLSLPSLSSAATTVVDSDKELQWLERQRSIDGSVVVRMPGLTSLSLPKLTEVSERLEIATANLHSVSLPALKTVGSDLNVGCVLHERGEWETKGPLAPLEPDAVVEPSFADGPGGRSGKSKSRSSEAGPAVLSLPSLRSVGGGLAVCSPGLLGVEAPKLTQVHRDLQLFASGSWRKVALPALTRVRSSLFLWLDGASLELSAGKLGTVGAAVQAGGAGTLAVGLPSLEMAAGLVLTGSRRTATGDDAPSPSLTLTRLDVGKLTRASQLVELRTVGGLTSLDLAALTETGTLRLDDLPDLVTVRAPGLTEVQGSVVLAALPALQELDLDGLVTVGQRYQLGGLGLGELELGVEQVGSLVLAGQQGSRVVAPKLRLVGAMLLEGLGLTELVSFPVLESVTSQLQVRDGIAGAAGGALPVLDAGDTTARVFEAPKLRQVGQTRKDGLGMRAVAFSVVRLPALREVHGDLLLADMPALTRLDLPVLAMVEGKVTLSDAGRIEVLELPALRRVEALELDGLTGLKRVGARQLETQVRQTRGTRVGVLELALP